MFKVGDRVKVVGTRGGPELNSDWIGTICSITGVRNSGRSYQAIIIKNGPNLNFDAVPEMQSHVYNLYKEWVDKAPRKAKVYRRKHV